jgi:hypothetical protein
VGGLAGAVEQIFGSYLTSALLLPRRERRTVYRSRPGPLARPPSHFPPIRPSLPACGTVEKFRPHPSHIGSALASTEWPANSVSQNLTSLGMDGLQNLETAWMGNRARRPKGGNRVYNGAISRDPDVRPHVALSIIVFICDINSERLLFLDGLTRSKMQTDF